MAGKYSLTLQLQLQSPNNVAQIVSGLQKQLGGVAVNVQVKNSKQAVQQVQQLTNATNGATSAAQKMGDAFGVSLKRFAAFSLASRAIGVFTRYLSNAVDESITFDRQLNKIKQVTRANTGQLSDLSKEITRLARTFGVASSEITETALILAQAGLNAKDTKIALEALTKTRLSATFGDINETAEGAVALLAQFGEGAGALETQLGALNAVSAQFAVESADLIEVIRRSGGVFKASGGSLEELFGLFTSVRATTRESAESIATALKTIFTRIQRPQTIQYLKDLGVELVNAEGAFVGPYEAIRRLSAAFGGLEQGSLKFIEIAEELGGYRQIGKVIPLLQQFTTAERARQAALAGGASLTEEAAIAQESLAVQFQKVREEFLALVRSTTQTDTFKILTKTVLSLATSLIRVADALKPVLPLLAAFAAIKFTRNIGGFFGGIGAALQKRQFGGKIHAFARGGMVPGSGNRDTVPAMLSPGEFVIRKSSVKKLGAGTLAAMNENKYNKGTVGKGVKPSKPLDLPTPSGKTNFTHVTKRLTENDFSRNKSAAKFLREKGIVGIYNNMGLDLPKEWNANWNIQKPDFLGAYSKTLADYIKNNDIFKTLKSGRKKYRFTGRSNSIAQQLLNKKDEEIKQLLYAKLKRGSSVFFDTDPDVSKVLPNLLKDSIKQSFQGEKGGAANTKKLIAGFQEYSVVKSEGKRQSTTEEIRKKLGQKKFFGGTVQRFVTGGDVKARLREIKAADKSSTLETFGSTSTKLGSSVLRDDEQFYSEGNFKNKTNLEKLTQFKKGLSGESEKYGGAFLFSPSNVSNLVAQINPQEIAAQAAKDNRLTGKSINNFKSNYPASQSVKIETGLLKNNIRESFENSLYDGLLSTIQNSARQLEAQTQIDLANVNGDRQAAKILSTSNVDQTIGNIFEATLKNAGGYFDELKKSDNIDFPTGLGDVADSFTNKTLAYLPTDAKASYTSALISSLVGKIEKDKKEQISQQLYNALKSGQKFALGGAVQRFAVGSKGKGVKPLKSRKAYVFDFDDTLAETEARVGAEPNNPDKFSQFRGDLAAKLIDSGQATQIASMARKRAQLGHDIYVLTARPGEPQTVDAINRFMQRVGAPAKGVIGVANMFAGEREPGKRPGTTRLLSTGSKKAKVLSQIAPNYDQTWFLDDAVENLVAAKKVAGVKTVQADLDAKKSVRRFAAGGAAPSDTVPALLTPGEFVFSKKSAQRIGYGNLNRMNKQGVAGYAKGGPVAVKKFAAGTGPNGVPSNDGWFAKLADDVGKALDRFVDKITGAAKKIESPAAAAAKPSSAATSANRQQRMRREGEEIDRKTEVSQKKQYEEKLFASKIQKQRKAVNIVDEQRAERDFYVNKKSQKEQKKEEYVKVIKDANTHIDQEIAKKKGEKIPGKQDLNNFILDQEIQDLEEIKKSFNSVGTQELEKLNKEIADLDKYAKKANEDLKITKQNLKGVVEYIGKQESARAPKSTKIPQAVFDKIDQEQAAKQNAQKSSGSGPSSAATKNCKCDNESTRKMRIKESGKTATDTDKTTSANKGRGFDAGSLLFGAGLLQDTLMQMAESAGFANESMVAFSNGLLRVTSTVGLLGSQFGSAIQQLKDEGKSTGGVKAAGLAVAGLSAVGAGLAAVGDYTSERGNKQYEKTVAQMQTADFEAVKAAGDKNVEAQVSAKRMQGFGDVGTFAGIGAMIGSMFGPIGTALGALAGAIAGLVKGLVGWLFINKESIKQEQNRKNADVLAAAASKDVEKAFKDIEMGTARFSGPSGLGKFVDAIATANAAQLKASREAGTTAEQRQKAEEEASARIMQSASVIGQRAQTEEEATKEIQRLSQNSDLTGTKLKEVQDAATRAAIQTIKLRDAQEALLKVTLENKTLSSAFNSASLAVDNFMNSLQVGSVGLTNTMATLEAAATNLNMAPEGEKAIAEIEKAALAQVGGSETGLGKTVTAQANRARAGLAISGQMARAIEGTALVAGDPQNKQRLTDALVATIPKGLDSDTQSKLQDLIEAEVGSIDLESGKIDTAALMDKLQGQLKTSFIDPLSETGKALAQQQQRLVELTRVRIEAENRLVEAQKSALDLQLESQKTIQEFGGKKVTPADEFAIRAKQFDVGGRAAGLGGVGAGTAEDIRRVSGQIRTRFAAQQTQLGGGGTGAGAKELDQDQRERLKKANQDLIALTRQRIEQTKQELEIIKQKNALEKSSIEKLLGGDVEGFMQDQAASAAANALRSGNTNLLGMFSAQTLGQAAKSLEGQMSPQEFAAALGPVLARFGIQDSRSAQVFAGATQEEQTLMQRGQQEAGLLAELGQNEAGFAQMELASAEMNIQTANIKFEEALKTAQIRSDEEQKRAEEAKKKKDSESESIKTDLDAKAAQQKAEREAEQKALNEKLKADAEAAKGYWQKMWENNGAAIKGAVAIAFEGVPGIISKVLTGKTITEHVVGEFQNAPRADQAQTKRRGGLIYASRGVFVARGTDTVPAMLTPGEFVVRREAVQAGNNLQILQAMNRGGGAGGVLSNGSQALAGGGTVQNITNNTNNVNVEQFASAVGKLEQAISQIPREFFHQFNGSTNMSVTGLAGLTDVMKNIASDAIMQMAPKLKTDTTGNVQVNNSVLG